MSDKRKYRKFTVQQKAELVLASFRGDRSIAEICRDHDISETLLRRWRDQMVEAGMERFQAAAVRDPEPGGGYRDPESQAFIESWFSKLMSRRLRWYLRG